MGKFDREVSILSEKVDVVIKEEGIVLFVDIDKSRHLLFHSDEYVSSIKELSCLIYQYYSRDLEVALCNFKADFIMTNIITEECALKLQSKLYGKYVALADYCNNQVAFLKQDVLDYVAHKNIELLKKNDCRDNVVEHLKIRNDIVYNATANKIKLVNKLRWVYRLLGITSILGLISSIYVYNSITITQDVRSLIISVSMVNILSLLFLLLYKVIPCKDDSYYKALRMYEELLKNYGLIVCSYDTLASGIKDELDNLILLNLDTIKNYI